MRPKPQLRSMHTSLVVGNAVLFSCNSGLGSIKLYVPLCSKQVTAVQHIQRRRATAQHLFRANCVQLGTAFTLQFIRNLHVFDLHRAEWVRMFARLACLTIGAWFLYYLSVEPRLRWKC